MNIRVATKADMPAVWALTYKAFRIRGFCGPNDLDQLQHYPHLDGISETTVLLAEDEDGLAGTISVTEDGLYGLHVDVAFLGVVRDAAEVGGKRVGAVWRLAMRVEQVLPRLIDAALGELARRQIEPAFIAVHPSDAGFYERRLGFEEVDRVDHDPTVNNAPAVLMIGRLETMLKKWKRKQ